MDKIKDIETALLVIQDAADKQAMAVDNADAKQANKHYDRIVKAMTFLKKYYGISITFIKTPFYRSTIMSSILYTTTK